MFDLLPAKNWNYDTAAHLLNRAGFGGTPAEIETLHGQGLEGAVDSLLQPPNELIDVSAQSWSKPVDLQKKRAELQQLKAIPAEQKTKRKEMRKEQRDEMQDLRFWWLTRMKETHAPLVEKMALFWHGHFATSAQKVNGAYVMWRQNATFRTQALGHFPTLLKAISRDPAMMVYLDLQQSNKGHPNENWAREVMELFTLGIGHYTEDDVKAAARAFTGYRIDPRTQEFHFNATQHDDTGKTFLGRTGNFSGDDVLDLIVAQPACPKFVGRKLWRFFVEDEPPAPSVEAMAGVLRRHGFQIGPVLRDVFLSEEFYSARARRTQIKSPVQFLVESCKLLETDLPPAKAADGALRSMGQILLAPPNVKGWDGGKSWVSTATLLFRYNFANYLLNGTGQQPNLPAGLRRDAVDLANLVPADLREKPEALIAALGQRLYQTPLDATLNKTLETFLQTQGTNPDDNAFRRLMHLMMSTPQFQLT